MHWWHTARQTKIKGGRIVALLCKIRSVGCHVERERSSHSSPFEAPSPSAAHLHSPPFEDVALHVDHTPSLITSVRWRVCVSARVGVPCRVKHVKRALVPLKRPERWDQSERNWATREANPVMHLMLGVVMETQGADFPLHWLPSVCRHFLKLFPRKPIERWEWKLVKCPGR